MIDPAKPYDHEAVLARYNKLVFVMVQIAQQQLYEEMGEEEQDYADFEMGYEQLVKIARAALDDCQESDKITN